MKPRVHHDECAELFGPYKERPEFRVGQFLAVDIGQDLDAFQLQFAHDVFELAHRELRFLQRDHAEADEPVRLARAVLDNALIGDLVGRFGYFWINRVVTLARRRGHDLDIDAHPVEVGQPAIDRGHDLGDILFLLRIDFPGGSIGKMRQWNAARIDMG